MDGAGAGAGATGGGAAGANTCVATVASGVITGTGVVEVGTPVEAVPSAKASAELPLAELTGLVEPGAPLEGPTAGA
jgi:hypothetical protein